MDVFLSYILDNKDWLLDGVGTFLITIPFAIIGWVYQKISLKRISEEPRRSVNICVKGNVTYYGESNQKNLKQAKVKVTGSAKVILVAFALIATLFGVILVQLLSPSNPRAQLIVASLGPTMLMFAHIPEIIKKLPINHRSIFAILFFTIYCIFISSIVYGTIYLIKKPDILRSAVHTSPPTVIESSKPKNSQSVPPLAEPAQIPTPPEQTIVKFPFVQDIPPKADILKKRRHQLLVPHLELSTPATNYLSGPSYVQIDYLQFGSINPSGRTVSLGIKDMSLLRRHKYHPYVEFECSNLIDENTFELTNCDAKVDTFSYRWHKAESDSRYYAEIKFQISGSAKLRFRIVQAGTSTTPPVTYWSDWHGNTNNKFMILRIDEGGETIKSFE